MKNPTSRAAVSEKLSLEIDDFCDLMNISRSFYYKLKASGRGPREMRVGARVLISKEAAAEWIRSCEATAAA